jgi:hypothetical protein
MPGNPTERGEQCFQERDEVRAEAMTFIQSSGRSLAETVCEARPADEGAMSGARQ